MHIEAIIGFVIGIGVAYLVKKFAPSLWSKIP